MFDRQKKKSLLLGICTFLVLSVVLAIFIHHLDENVFKTLAGTQPGLLCVLLLFSCTGIVLNGVIYKTAFRCIDADFSLSDGIELAGIRIFGGVAFIAGGAMTVQSFYLYKKKIMPGESIGITTWLYIVQKTSVMLYAAILLCFHWKWVHCNFPSLFSFLVFSYIFCLLAILILSLLCTSKYICKLVLHLIKKLPEAGKWPNRKNKWSNQICILYRETHTLFRSPKVCCGVLFLNFIKLFVYCAVPFTVTDVMKVNPYSFMRMQTLSAFVLLISNALPNISGMGSVEFSFMLVFSECLSASAAVMIYFRCATYYFPFLLSIFIVLFIERKISRTIQADSQKT